MVGALDRIRAVRPLERLLRSDWRERALAFLRVERARLPVGDRPALAHDLALVRQKRSAATLLSRRGANAEALALAVQAVAAARAAAQRAPLDDRLRARLDAFAPAAVPDLDARFEGEHLALLEGALALVRDVESSLGDATLTDLGARVRRVTRPLTVLLALAGVVAAIYGTVRVPPYMVRASAWADPALSAGNAMDNDSRTVWALPDKTPGYLDVFLMTPRRVNRVKLLNSNGLPVVVHGAKDFRVEVVVDKDAAKTIDDSFGEFTVEPTWKTIEIGGVDRVRMIRISISSWFGDGGGLAEVVVE